MCPGPAGKRSWLKPATFDEHGPTSDRVAAQLPGGLPLPPARLNHRELMKAFIRSNGTRCSRSRSRQELRTEASFSLSQMISRFSA